LPIYFTTPEFHMKRVASKLRGKPKPMSSKVRPSQQLVRMIGK
jgi:hypothetical protein